MTEKQIHQSHADSLRRRFLHEGTASLDDGSALELLLSFAMPSDKAQEASQTLIRRFGSISGVLDASIDEISSVWGVGEDTAVMIKLIPSLFEIYIDRKTNIAGERYDNIEKLGRYLVGRYATARSERVLLLLLDNSYRLICEETVCEGSVNSARLSGKALCELAKEKRASAVVLSHNHPGGIALPSTDDIDTTAALAALFEGVGIPMLEHILVAGDEYTPIMYTKLGKKRVMPVSSYGEV